MNEIERVFKLLDKIDEKLDDLCGRMMKVEINQKNHYKEIENKQNNKDRRFYIIIVGMGVLFTTIEVLQNWS